MDRILFNTAMIYAYGFQEIINHPFADMSLLRLPEPYANPPSASPICLPDQPSADLDGLNVVTSGWGRLQSGKKT